MRRPHFWSSIFKLIFDFPCPALITSSQIFFSHPSNFQFKQPNITNFIDENVENLASRFSWITYILCFERSTFKVLSKSTLLLICSLVSLFRHFKISFPFLLTLFLPLSCCYWYSKGFCSLSIHRLVHL